MANRHKLQTCTRYIVLVLGVLTLVACGRLFMDDQELVQSAREYLVDDDFKAASIELKNALQKNPDNAEARYLLGAISLKFGDYATAVKEFRRADKAGWQELAHIGLARALLGQNDFQVLLDESEIRESYPATVRADLLALRAAAEAGLGNMDQAETTLAEAATLQADAIYVLKSTIQLQALAGHAKEAKETLARALNKYPENPEFLLLSANTDIQDGNMDAARGTYRKVINYDPHGYISVNGRQARLGLIRLQILARELDQAEVTIRPLFRRNSRDPDANYLGGVLAFEQGNYDLAEERVLKVLKLAPDHSPTQLLFGTISYAQADYEQAVYYLSKYVTVMPGHMDVRKLLGRTYLMLGQHEEAQAALQPVLKRKADDAELLGLVGLSELQRGEVTAGIAKLEKAISASPDSDVLRGELARAYIAAGDTDRAIQELQAILMRGGSHEQTEALLVRAYLQAGQFDQAINITLDLLARYPADPAVMVLAGSVFAASGDSTEARTYFTQALQAKPYFLPAAMALARVEELDGNVADAAALYQGLIDSGVESSAPLLAMARLAKQQGNRQEMLGWLEKASAQVSEDNNSRMLLADYYLRENQPEKAKLLIREAIKAEPRKPELLAIQGRILMTERHFKEALSPLNELVTVAPESTYALTLLAKNYLLLKQFTDARTQLDTALELQADFAPALALRAKVELHAGELDRALDYSKQFQQARPDLASSHEVAGDVWMARQDYAAANTAYTQAWEREQTSGLAIKLSRSLTSSGQPREATKPLLTWLDGHAGDIRTREFLGTVYQNTGQDKKAIQAYEKVLAAEPQNQVVLNNLAWLYALATDPKALEFGERAYQANPDVPGIQDTYGWILVQHGQVEKGRRLLKQAMEKLSGVAEVRYHYAVALFKSGHEKEARQMLEVLLREESSFEGRDEAVRIMGGQG
jgi:putative PEP-CTERM system TPR-repeat lipoprotein